MNTLHKLWYAASSLLLLVTLGVPLCTMAGCGTRAAEPLPPPLPTVTIAKPITQTIVEWDAYTGRIEAVDLVEIRARVDGYLLSVHFEEGQVVQENDLLFVIDPAPFEAEYKAAKATQQQAESLLKQAFAKLDEAEARVQQSEAQRNLAERRYARAEPLRQSNAITKEDLDERDAELVQASADKVGAEASIKSAEAAIATAEAAIELAAAGVETADLNLKYTQIRAPINGRISRQAVTPGNLIAGGTATSSLLTTIASLDPIYCVFDASEQDVLKYMRLAASGQRESSRVAKNPVFLGLVDESGFPHEGHMDFVDNRFDINTASMRARSIFPNEEQRLLPGMFARIRIPGSSPSRAVLIPDSAIGTDQASQFVYVVVHNVLVNDVVVENVIERRAIKPGPIVDGLRVIREGLDGNEDLVIEGLLRARPKAQVETNKRPIVLVDDGLPDDYTPWSKDRWLSPARAPMPKVQYELRETNSEDTSS